MCSQEDCKSSRSDVKHNDQRRSVNEAEARRQKKMNAAAAQSDTGEEDDGGDDVGALI